MFLDGFKSEALVGLNAPARCTGRRCFLEIKVSLGRERAQLTGGQSLCHVASPDCLVCETLDSHEGAAAATDLFG